MERQILKETDPNADYYREAASWSDDVNASLRASRSRAWWVAGIAMALAIIQGLALVLLMPLKTIIPYTITVDRQTGATELSRGVDLGPLAGNEALTRATLAQYVLARETLDQSDIADNFKKIGLWSTGTARSDYLRSMDRNSPGNVLADATAATQVRTVVRSISLTSPTTALVRFSTDRRDGEGPISRRDWASVISFGFSGAPLSAEDRLINPLGFQVSRYRRDAESLAPIIVTPGDTSANLIVTVP